MSQMPGSSDDGGLPDGRPTEDAVDSVEWLLKLTEEDTEAVVEQLRESGTRYYVSESNVDDVLERIRRPDDTEGLDDDTRSTRFELTGGPRKTVSTRGIDDVFEKLEAQAADREPRTKPAPGETDGDARPSTPAITRATDDPDFEEIKGEFGTLSGGSPDRTVSDRSVDDVLDLVSDDPDESRTDPDERVVDSAAPETDPAAIDVPSASVPDDPVGDRRRTVDHRESSTASPTETQSEADTAALLPEDPEAALVALLSDAVDPDAADDSTDSSNTSDDGSDEREASADTLASSSDAQSTDTALGTASTTRIAETDAVEAAARARRRVDEILSPDSERSDETEARSDRSHESAVDTDPDSGDQGNGSDTDDWGNGSDTDDSPIDAASNGPESDADPDGLVVNASSIGRSTGAHATSRTDDEGRSSPASSPEHPK